MRLRAALLVSVLGTMTGTAHAAPSGHAAPWGDSSVLPRTRSPAVVGQDTKGRKADPTRSTSSWTRATLRSPFADGRRRMARTHLPAPFGHMLLPGEKFRFDVNFAGNPAGLAEAEIVAGEPDPRSAPTLQILGRARTSGVVSLLATVTDEIRSVIDAETGAAVHSVNVLHYDGFAPKYKHRVTDQRYEGRGQVRIVDTKDDKEKRKLKVVPVDTFDPMSAMAWVRTLPFEKGVRYKAHVIDGTTLMRVEIEAKGRGAPAHLPGITRALELGPNDIVELEGKLTRVDGHDQPIPGKKAYAIRAWVSGDERRIPLVMESDMWVGAIRLELSAYDPPPRPTRDASPRATKSTPTTERP
ncbi:MAG: DUF3108 domain-containing protein [Nannocystaceae bacterium]|nr:DUF3108 domain-containing protein [bacterium]